MNGIRFSYRKIAQVFVIVAFMVFNTKSILYAQGPTAPEATSFEPVDATDMVNLLTGDLSYVIPLINVPGPDGGYPISLSYHGGVSLEQQASWVGLGWNLNPGAINRSVNGYPDDWSQGSIVEFFHDESSETINTLSVGYGVPGAYEIGTSLSWGSNRSLGGSISISGGLKSLPTDKVTAGVNFTIGTDGASVGGSIGIKNQSGSTTGFNASIGTNGYSLGISNGGKSGNSLGLNYSNNFEGESSFGVSFSTSGSKGNSLSIGLNSDGIKVTGKVNGAGTGINVQFHQTVSSNDYDISRTGWRIPLYIPTPSGVFNVSFGQQKIKYELNKEANEIVNGTLFLNEFRNNTQTLFARVGTDWNGGGNFIYGEWFIINNTDDLPQLPSNQVYEFKTEDDEDKFMDIYEVDLYNNQFGAPQLTENNPTFPNYDSYDINSQGMSGSISPRMLENAALQGLETQIDDDQGYSLSYEVPSESHFAYGYTEFDADVNFYFNNDNSTSLFVNPVDFDDVPADDIFDYLSSSNVDQVLPRKKGSRFIETFTNDEIASGVSDQAGLLRFSTDTDYGNDNLFEPDGIGAYKITAADGKTYHYALAVYNHEVINRRFGTIEKNRPETDSYFEKRQLKKYATHWLLTNVTGPDFIDINNNHIADEGDYGYWIDFDYGKWSSAYAWKTPYGEDYSEENLDVVDLQTGAYKTMKYYSWGRKDIYYLDAIKTRTHTALFIKDIREDNVGYEISHQAKRPDKATYTVDVPAQKLLKLKTIALAPNSKLSGINKINSQNLTSLPNQSIVLNWQEKNVNAVQNGQNEVLDIGDFNANELQTLYNSSVKIIDLATNYELANDSPNSVAQNEGRLTLNSVIYKGKGGVQMIPSFDFEYVNTKNFDLTQKGNWGFHKTDEDNWSLSMITTPEGGKIIIEQEPDIFHQTSILNDGNSFEVESVTRNHSPTNNTLTVGFFIEDRINIHVGDKVHVSYWGDCYDIVIAGDPPSSDDDEPLYTWNYSGLATITSISNGLAIAASDGEAYCNDPDCPVSDEVQCNGNELERAVVRSPDGKFYERKGGGLRVKSIAVTDNMESFKTEYNYDKKIFYNEGGNTVSEDVSSGIVSYVPHEEELIKKVPYASELPPPIVMYENVTVQSVNGNNTVTSGKTKYTFEVMSPDNFLNIVNVSYGDGLPYNISNESENANVNIKNHVITNSMAEIGRVLSIETFNKEEQLLSKTENTYLEQEEMVQGIIQESFQTYKIIDYDVYTDINGNEQDRWDDWIINSSTRKIYPNVLKSSTVTSGGLSSTTYFNSHDSNTGQVLETSTFASNGVKFKTKTVPAYTIPEYNPIGGYGMGSKVDNITNKNMLTQEAANFTYLIDYNGKEKVASATINTWNNDWTYIDYTGTPENTTAISHKIWRAHKNYIWKGGLNEDGTYANFTNGYANNYDGFDWGIGEDNQPEQWQMIAETTLYDHYSMPLETKDINGNYAATRMGDRSSKVLAVSNAGYGEMFYSGLENDDLINDYADSQVLGKNQRTTTVAHTGTYSASINPGDNAHQSVFGAVLRADTYRAGKYKLSVWVHKDNYQNARYKTSYNGTKYPLTGEKIFAGDWVQLNHYIDYTPAQVESRRLVVIASNSGTILADDFRFHPIQSSMSSYVYNEWDELTHIIGANNMATRYEYDEAGRLERTFAEVADTPTIIGGFKQVSAYNQNYKRNATEDTTDDDTTDDTDTTQPLSGTIGIFTIGCNNGIYQLPDLHKGVHGQVGVSGGSGNYGYKWQWRLNNSGPWTTYTNNGNYTMLLAYNPDISTLCGGPGNNGDAQQIQLRCIVSDISNTTIANKTLTSGSEYLSCTTCEGGGNQE